ncbi:MAG TPA: S8 family serine peptidase, partial [Chryseosolibacter sp.]|nr:S8 family serine peptidase [Chryseosolibacter sp.]
MTKLYRQFYLQIVASVILFFGIHPSINAQETVQGVVRLKVSESLAATLERQALARSPGGEVLTGVASLDQLNKQFNIRRFSRVFPHAGKHEARHRKHGLHLWYEAALDRSIPVSTVMQSYQSEAQILRVEPVYKKALIGSASTRFGPRLIKKQTPDDAILPGNANDPLLASQWHYHNTGQTGGSPGADIDLFNAWKIETGKKNVVIAVTDGGVDVDHPDLVPNLWINTGEIPGNDRDDDNNGYIDDVHGFSFVHGQANILPDNHGTHVAGTVAAVTNNNEGVAGVAGGSGTGDGVRIMSCAVFHADSLSDGFAEAYVYSADNGAVISQNSWGYTLPGLFEQVVLDAIDYFIEEAGKGLSGQQTGPIDGGVVIFSAGNYNDEAGYYPASYPPVVAVASSTHKDTRSRYSNYGSWIDIIAPGGETYEIDEEGVISTLPHGNYGWYMGTSMACPHVSGVAGLIVSKFGRPGLSGEAVRQRLLASVDNIDALNPGFEGKLGAGRLNALTALAANDQTPPRAITDLKILRKGVGEITLGWTSPGDGQHAVSAYDIRYSTSPITPSNFARATAVSEVPAPATPGSKESFTVKDLPGGVLFYFAIRSQNFAGNFSALSNIASGTASETPAIQVSPTALTVDLKTAEQTSRNVTITNKGKGQLQFKVTLADAPRAFASVTDSEGVVNAGATKTIRITFDASRLLAGSYNQALNIESNDPLNKLVSIAMTLRVTENGAPIASSTPASIDFKSVQIGESQTRKVRISNSGSEPLTISKISSSHAVFRSLQRAPITVPSFEYKDVDVVFAPTRIGKFSAELSFNVNDPERPLLKVAVQGEALREAPVAVSPNSFNETLEQGSLITRTMVLRNNGSQDRQYRIEVTDSRLINVGQSSTARKIHSATAVQNDSAIARYNKRRQTIERELSRRSQAERALANSVGGNRTARKKSTDAAETRRYTTGFEEFAIGSLNEQHGWYTSQGWNIDTVNAASGEKHLRGSSQSAGGGEKFALSPYLFEADEYLYPRYTSASMRINADAARGTTWEIVPQDPWSYIATRIRFNPDGSMEALVIDNDYNFHWKKIPVQTPSGYFNLAIEYNSWGSDTSGFPTYLLFVNNQHVFSGTGLSATLSQVAFVSPMETTGSLFDIDQLSLNGHEYLQPFITAPAEKGTIPAGESVNVALAFDATVMKYGSYATDVLVHIDDTDTLKVPAALT